MAYQYILLERSEGVGIVTLNRPEQLNALNLAMLQELNDVFRGMYRDPQIRAILLTGAGKAFSSGEDWKQRAEQELGTASLLSSDKAMASTSNVLTPVVEGGGVSYQPSEVSTSAPFGVFQPPALAGTLNVPPAVAPQFAQNTPLNPNPLEVSRSLPPSPQPVETKSGPLFNPEAVVISAANASSTSSDSPNNGTSLTDQLRKAYIPLIRQIRLMEKPVIAAVNGIAAGTGLGLALACDIRYASEKARFVETSLRMGLPPSSGSAYFLQRILGTYKAMEIILSGEDISATRAEQLGLISRIFSTETMLDESRKLATHLAKGPSRAVGLTKGLLYRSAYLTLEQSLELEAQVTEEAARTSDYKEALQAYQEKRIPQFKGQ